MSAEVLQLRPFQSARDQAKKLGTNVTMAIIRRIAAEQRNGNSGNSVAHELQMRRLTNNGGTPPEAA